ncbi:putative oxidoreductase [Aspergillus heteromorphus CBS 117.55]|uniref:Putative oxidoreductase n=1 Tax=Aspergillus heteromorphus CBS 117.55 TaxID=1448321 RepID=A0A317W9R2_9EURO|nr:putative oxidoreductase [Aspergillus heteromorphus CBS 117.55]PWY83334.1 putative oxidoreductase [Aspergillus heteromorphus CBS 117.55]
MATPTPSTPSTPVRTALIGLSASAITAWASQAHLPALRSHPDVFALAALCNSSEAAADAAIRAFELDPTTVRAHGQPDALAADPAVDLVICCTRVDRHFETVLPSVQAGKSVYLEWPIASSLAHVEALQAAARASGAPVAVGLQGRFGPLVRTLQGALQSGRIGRVLSTEVRAFGGTRDREVLPVGLKYFADREVGGNPITIGFGHLIDQVQFVVGDLVPGTDHIHLQVQRPDVRLRDAQSGEFVGHTRSNVPDLVSLHGSLPETAQVAAGASLVAYFARGQPYPGDPALTWTLTGESGTLRLTSPTGIFMQADTGPERPILTVLDHATGAVEEIPWAWSETQLAVPVMARAVQGCLVSFATGRTEGYVSLDDAAGRARQIARWLDALAQA